MNESSQNFLGSLVNLMFRDAKLIIVVWIICILVALVSALLAPKTYEAKSTLLIKFGRDYVYRSETGDQRSTALQRAGMEEAINSEVQILASRDIKERVITDIGIQKLYPETENSKAPLESALRKFGKGLSIRSIERSNIINLYFQHQNPELSAMALNRLVAAFAEKRLDVFRNSDVSFFDEQVAKLTAELRDSEGAFGSFRTEHKIFELSRQTELLVEQRNRLSNSLAEAQRAISELQVRRQSLSKQLDQLPEIIVLYTNANQGRMHDQARSELFDLQLEEKKLLGSYREDSKAVSNIRQRIQQIEQLLASQDEDISGQSVRTGPNKAYQSVFAERIDATTELSAMKVRGNTLKTQIGDAEHEINRLSSLRSRYDEMARTVESRRLALQTQLSNLADARAFAALDDQNKTNIRVVQSAVTPESAIGMSRKSKVLLSVPLGLIAGLLLPLGINVFRTQVSEPLSIKRKSGLDVLATIDRSD